MMAESVNDVATVQRSLQRTLQSTEDELAAQARLTRDLQDDLLRTRMVEFESLSDRLYRVVRQAAKETGKQVRLDIVGGSIEIDRGVLDRMTGRLRAPAAQQRGARHRAARSAHGGGQGRGRHDQHPRWRRKATKSRVEFRDDGAGLDLARIREQGRGHGPAGADAQPSDAELAQPDLHARLQHGRRGDRTGRPRRRHGRGARRGQRHGRAHRDRHRAPARAPASAGAAADHGGDAGGDAALRRADASPCRRRWSRWCGASSGDELEQAYAERLPSRWATRRCRSSGSARCCRLGARGSAAGPHAAGGGDPQRRAARGAACRRSAGQPGSGGQEPRVRSCRACPAWPA